MGHHLVVDYGCEQQFHEQYEAIGQNAAEFWENREVGTGVHRRLAA
jgi:hypothetical protein